MNSNTTDSLRMVQIGAEWLTTSTGGLNRYTEGLSRALANKGVHQQWLVLGDEDLTPSDHVHVKAVAPPSESLLNRFSALRREATSLAGFDLTASHFALCAYPLRRRLAKMPHVVHFHGPWADESRAEGAGWFATAFKRHIERTVYSTADRCITLSQAFADILAERYRVHPSRIRVVPGGIDADRFDSPLSKAEARASLGWDLDRPTILCVRRLVHRMGLESLVQAMQSIVASQREALLLIAGKGPLTPLLQQAIADRQLQSSVRLLGFVPDEQLPTAYRAADLTVVPSQSLEGFGLIIAESLAAGTPALVTPVGGMPEVVAGLSNDLILNGSGCEDLASGVIEAIEGRRVMPSAQECQSFAAANYAWISVAKRVLAVYHEAMNSHD